MVLETWECEWEDHKIEAELADDQTFTWRRERGILRVDGKRVDDQKTSRVFPFSLWQAKPVLTAAILGRDGQPHALRVEFHLWEPCCIMVDGKQIFPGSSPADVKNDEA